MWEILAATNTLLPRKSSCRIIALLDLLIAVIDTLLTRTCASTASHETSTRPFYALGGGTGNVLHRSLIFPNATQMKVEKNLVESNLYKWYTQIKVPN